MPEKRSYYEELAKTKGFQAVDSVSKELGLLVAADVNAASSKRVKAAKLGVKIIALDDFIAMENSAEKQAAGTGEIAHSTAALPVEIPLFSEKTTSGEPEAAKDKAPEQLSFGF